MASDPSTPKTNLFGSAKFTLVKEEGVKNGKSALI